MSNVTAFVLEHTDHVEDSAVSNCRIVRSSAFSINF